MTSYSCPRISAGTIFAPYIVLRYLHCLWGTAVNCNNRVCTEPRTSRWRAWEVPLWYWKKVLKIQVHCLFASFKNGTLNVLPERAIIGHDDTLISDMVLLLYDDSIVWFVVCLWFQFLITSLAKGFKIVYIQFHVVPNSPVIHWIKVFWEGHRVPSWRDMVANLCVMREAGEEILCHWIRHRRLFMHADFVKISWPGSCI